MTKDLRHIAHGILVDAASPRVTLDQALDRHDPDISGLTAKDRALCHAIVFGVLRHRGHLDHLIRTFSNRPLERLDLAVAQVLRMGLFQMVFLDRVPDFAAIDTAVELTKSRINRKSAGFVNAVLRKASQNHRSIAPPSETRQFSAHLRVACSIPKWLGDRWTRVYGKTHTLALGRSLMEIPALTLRMNTLKTNRDELAGRLNQAGLTTEKTQISSAGLHISHPNLSIAELPGYADGEFQVQDEAAQLVTQLLNPGPDEIVLDACAGLGGKTCHMAQLMENRGKIVAADIDPAKLDRLGEEAQRLSISIIRVSGQDLASASVHSFGHYFDRVLVDAPCTGLGVIRRNPDTRWKRGLKDIQRMAAQQKKLLKSAAGLVRPGGVLVYAVCSCEPEENEEVIGHFLENGKIFYRIKVLYPG